LQFHYPFAITTQKELTSTKSANGDLVRRNGFSKKTLPNFSVQSLKSVCSPTCADLGYRHRINELLNNI